MITAPVGVELRPLTIPASVDSPDAADFIEMVRVRNRVYREISGHDDHRIAADELLPRLPARRARASTGVDRERRRRRWSAASASTFPSKATPSSRSGSSSCVRDVWGRGIGSAAYELVERTARENGRTVLQSWAEHPDAPGPRLAAPTGFGTIPKTTPRASTCGTGTRSSRSSATAPSTSHGSFDAGRSACSPRPMAASAEYRVVQWYAPTPPEFVDGYAWMKSRMVTDAPAAGLEFDEETWDAARIARHDAMYTDAGRTAARDRGAAHRQRRALRVQRARDRRRIAPRRPTRRTPSC